MTCDRVADVWIYQAKGKLVQCVSELVNEILITSAVRRSDNDGRIDKSMEIC